MKSNLLGKVLGLILGIFAVGLFFPSVWVWSQGYEGPDQAASVEFSEDEIESFAQVQDEIVDIQREYNTIIAEEQDQDRRRTIIEEANQKMIEAIRGEGLSIEVYNQILIEAQNNSSLMERIERASQ